MTAKQRQNSIEGPAKVFDTSGIEAARTQDSLTQSFDNAQQESTQNNSINNNASLDSQANGLLNLNGVPVSPSTGTTRAALMRPDKRGNTVQVDEDSRITTYT